MTSNRVIHAPQVPGILPHLLKKVEIFGHSFRLRAQDVQDDGSPFQICPWQLRPFDAKSRRYCDGFYNLAAKVDMRISDRATIASQTGLLTIFVKGLLRVIAALVGFGPVDPVAVAALVAGPNVEPEVSKLRQTVGSGIV